MKNTLEKTSKQASTKATVSMTIPTDVFNIARKMAKEDGMPVGEWLEQLVREKLLTEKTPPIGYDRNGNMVITDPVMAAKVDAITKRKGITTEDFLVEAMIEEGHRLAMLRDHPGKLPIYLPAETVRFLTEVCEAGGIDVDEFANGVLGDIVSGSLAGMGDAEGLVLDSWRHEDREADEIAMKAVVERWKGKDAVPA